MSDFAAQRRQLVWRIGRLAPRTVLRGRLERQLRALVAAELVRERRHSPEISQLPRPACPPSLSRSFAYGGPQPVTGEPENADDGRPLMWWQK